MKLLKWGPHTKWFIASVGIATGVATLVLTIINGYNTGAIDPNAWLYWKANAITGFTYNPGYLFLTIHTILFVVATVYVVKIYRLLKKGWDIRLWDNRK